ncbi:TPA: hypothetical protein DF272_06955 [Candidatus Falkowbacteria bacterium]|nr:hypothetical protein [Candidatus Falkowbacteria bacterium]
MLWIFIAFIGPILHGFANVLDNYLTNKLFKSVWTLTFYSTFFNILFLPLVLLVDIPGLPPVPLLPFFFLVALIEVLYLYPYYKALQSDDTSVVSSLFSLGKIFVPIFAFLLVGEVLTLTQYLGFFIIILGGAALTLSNHGAFRFNKAFFYMLACSILLAIEAVVYKYLFENISWSTGFFWATLFSSVIIFCFLFVPKLRRDIRLQTNDLKRNAPVFALEEFLTFGGSAASTFAISLVPVTLAKSIDAFQPFFVLVYALVLGKSFPRMFRESVDLRSVIKKFIFFTIMVIGIILIVS